MFTIVDKIPKSVKLSPDFQQKAAKSKGKGWKRKFKYIPVLYFGRTYYFPITKAIWEAFELSKRMQNQDGGYVLGTGPVEEALRDILGAMHLQVRDDVLNGIEQTVVQQVQDRLSAMMRVPLRAELERMADEREAKLLGSKEDAGEAKA